MTVGGGREVTEIVRRGWGVGGRVDNIPVNSLQTFLDGTIYTHPKHTHPHSYTWVRYAQSKLICSQILSRF